MDERSREELNKITDRFKRENKTPGSLTRFYNNEECSQYTLLDSDIVAYFALAYSIGLKEGERKYGRKIKKRV